MVAHSGTHAGEQPVDWPAEQVQSGRDDAVPGRVGAARTLAQGLALFSIGLGAVQLIAPRRLTGLIGVPATQTSVLVTRIMGARELAHGVGMLMSRNPALPAWSRVAGDVLDLGLLGRASGMRGAQRGRVVGAMAAVAGTTAADVLDGVGLKGQAERVGGATPMRVKAAVTIDRSAEDIYRYWRDFENLPDVMTHLRSVVDVGDGRSRWTVRAPLGSSATWEAEVLEDVPGEVISWQSLPDSQIDNSGDVRLRSAPGDRGTELHVMLRYESPVGSIGAALLKLFGDDPVQQVKDDLRRFKQAMETGQVVRSDGAPYGTDARLQPKQRPAQPASD